MPPGKKMKRFFERIVLLSIAALLMACSVLPASFPEDGTPNQPTQGWQVSTPEEQGMDADILQQMFPVIEAQNLNIDAVFVVRNGYIVAEKYYPVYEQDTLHEMYSVTKSVISALVGIAIREGFINDIDDPVKDYFPERTFKNADPRKSTITLEHLLTMTSGLAWDYQEMISNPDWVQYTLDQPVITDPGTSFSYNSGNSHILSAIIQKTSGMDTREFAKEYLFDPLGISDFRWQTAVDDIPKGGWGMAMRPRDMAKLGYLYLNQGVWDGIQVIPGEWIEVSTQPYTQVPDTLEPWEVSMGYSWWLHEDGLYAAHGMKGQFVYVIPNLSIVVVITANIPDEEFHLPQQLIREYIIQSVMTSAVAKVYSEK